MMRTEPYCYGGPFPRDMKQAPPEVRRAKTIFGNQLSRCGNPKCRSYATYGAKGIRVKYSMRGFVGWYLDAVKSWDSMEKPVVSRIDHSKDYDFGNIQLTTPTENSRERISRCGHPLGSTAISIYDKASGRLVAVARNRHHATELTGVPRNSLIRALTIPNWKSRHRFLFVRERS